MKPRRALANVFGVGSGTLMVRLLDEKKPDDARKVASHAVNALIACLIFYKVNDPSNGNDT